MKKEFKIAIIITGIVVTILILAGMYIQSRDNLKFKFEYESYNNVSYSNGKTINVNIDINNKIKYLDSSNLMDVLKSEYAVVYMGYSSCPWCRNIVPLLINTTNNDSRIKTLYYFDVEQDYSNIKDELYDYLDEYLGKDEDSNKHIYVPDVFFIKNGEVVYHHLSTVESYTNPYLGMNEMQKEELNNYYIEGLNKLYGDEVNE